MAIKSNKYQSQAKAQKAGKLPQPKNAKPAPSSIKVAPPTSSASGSAGILQDISLVAPRPTSSAGVKQESGLALVLASQAPVVAAPCSAVAVIRTSSVVRGAKHADHAPGCTSPCKAVPAGEDAISPPLDVDCGAATADPATAITVADATLACKVQRLRVLQAVVKVAPSPAYAQEVADLVKSIKAAFLKRQEELKDVKTANVFLKDVVLGTDAANRWLQQQLQVAEARKATMVPCSDVEPFYQAYVALQQAHDARLVQLAALRAERDALSRHLYQRNAECQVAQMRVQDMRQGWGMREPTPAAAPSLFGGLGSAWA